MTNTTDLATVPQIRLNAGPFATASRGAVDLFAGPGGWDVAARRLGIDVLGIEYDETACATREAADLDTLQADVSTLDPRSFPAHGRIASPPCQGFSLAGKGQARKDAGRLIAALDRCRTASDVSALIADARGWMTHEGTALVLEPLRWALACPPSWLAWEQVPAVLPLWEACARILRRLGYSVATGIVSAERYGVPQTRRRAIFLARAPWLTAELGPVALPAPTHSRYHARTPDRLDPGVLPWVSMAEALSWGMTARPYPTIACSRSTGGPDKEKVGGSGARKNLYAERDAGKWVHGPGCEHEPRDCGVDLDELARIVKSRENDQTGTPYDPTWPRRRPAMTIATRGLVCHPGPNANRFNGSTKSRNDSIRITVEEAGMLQSFPTDYPWQGTETKKFQQVGNAIPPLLAEACLAAVTGVPFRPRPGGRGRHATPGPWVLAAAGAAAERTAGQVPRELHQPAATITGKGTAVWKIRGTTGRQRVAPAAALD